MSTDVVSVAVDQHVVPAAVAPLEGEQLKLAIMKQFEFYFSPENLANDPFLVSKMDAEKYVDLAVVAGFGKVKLLTEDVGLIVEALEPSLLVELDATKSKVRAVTVKPSRTTLALRQVDASATAEALTSLFEAGGFKPSNMRSDIGNFWFADFASEEETTRALEYIRTQKFADQPIRARIKTSTVLSTSSYYYPAEPVQAAYYPSYVPVGGAWVPAAGAYAFAGYEGQEGQAFVPNYAKPDGGRGRPAARGKAGRKEGARKGQGPQRDEDGKRKAGRKGRTAPTKEAGQAAPAAGKRPDQKPPQLTPAHFPPLPNAKKGGGPGYKGNFKKYSAEELVAKMQDLKVEKPSDMPECAVVTDEPVASVELAKEAPPNFDAIQSSGVTLSDVVKSAAKGDASTAAGGAALTTDAAEQSGKSDAKTESTGKEVAKDDEPDEPAKPTWSQMVRKAGGEEEGAPEAGPSA